MNANESAGKHEPTKFELTCPCAQCGEHVPTTRIETGFAGEFQMLCVKCLDRGLRRVRASIPAPAQPLVPATEGPNELPMRAEFEKWWMELQNEDSPLMDELDETSIPQRAMLAAFCKKAWRAALAESQRQAAPLPTQSRSVQRRIAAQKGEPAPTFAAAAPATEGKLREDAEHRLFEANVLVGKIQKIVREALPGERWSEWDVLDQGVLQALAQVRREALLEAAKIAERVQMEMDVPTRSHATAERILAAIRALAAQPTPAPKEQR